MRYNIRVAVGNIRIHMYMCMCVTSWHDVQSDCTPLNSHRPISNVQMNKTELIPSKFLLMLKFLLLILPNDAAGMMTTTIIQFNSYLFAC
jgi:hypothetical protein